MVSAAFVELGEGQRRAKWRRPKFRRFARTHHGAVHSVYRMNILGINAYHGNASAAIVCDGRLIAAVEEERFNRVKYAAGFPAQAIQYCLKTAGLKLHEIDHVAVPRNPYARMATKLFFALRM